MEKLNLDSIFNDSQLCQKAYKKLKSDVYYDKTQVILKKEIVEFEANKKSAKELDDSLIEIWKN